MVAGCASRDGQQVYLFHGPDPVLEQFVAASRTCGYPHIELTRGGHLESMVVLHVPSPKSAEFDCAWSWAEAHERDGLTTGFSESYRVRPSQ